MHAAVQCSAQDVVIHTTLEILEAASTSGYLVVLAGDGNPTKVHSRME